MPIPKEWLQCAPKPQPLNKPNEWHVFLSYRSVDRTWVLNLYDVLIEIGYKVFLDQYVLKAGDKLIKNLQNALDKSQSGVLIWSAATGSSEWVNDEYETLQTKANQEDNFIFFPVKLDNSKLPTFAANRIYVDFIAYPDGPNGGELLRLLWALNGSSLPDNAVRFANEQSETSAEINANVQSAIDNGRWQRLIELFEEDGLPWKTSAALGCKAAEGLIKLKKNTQAINMLEKLEEDFKKALRPKQLKALALACRGNKGDVDKAQDILGTLHAKNYLNPETMGIYARTWMDIYSASDEPDINDLIKFRNLYAEAFEKAPDNYYTGINAASKSVFIGMDKDLKKAAEYAEKVEKLVGVNEVPGDYWKTATVGEVFLIQKKYAEAGDMYEKAVAIEPKAKASHVSTLLQAKRLMEKLKPSGSEQAMVVNAFRNIPGYDKI